MRTNTVRSFTILALASVALSAQAEIIAQYTAPGGSFAATTTATGIQAFDLNNNFANSIFQPGVSYPDSVYLEPVGATNATEAVANNSYFQFLLFSGQNTMNLSSLTFDVARGSNPDPRGWILRSSIDNFATDIASGLVTTTQPNLSSVSVDLTGAQFQNRNAGLTFRIYDYTPGSGYGLFFDNITVNGATVLSTPAPVAALPFALGLLRRRRRKA